MTVWCGCSSDVLSLSDICLHVAEVISNKKKASVSRQSSLLPQYNCLLMSPAQFWSRDKQRYFSHSQYSSRSATLCVWRSLFVAWLKEYSVSYVWISWHSCYEKSLFKVSEWFALWLCSAEATTANSNLGWLLTSLWENSMVWSALIEAVFRVSTGYSF